MRRLKHDQDRVLELQGLEGKMREILLRKLRRLMVCEKGGLSVFKNHLVIS